MFLSCSHCLSLSGRRKNARPRERAFLLWLRVPGAFEAQCGYFFLRFRTFTRVLLLPSFLLVSFWLFFAPFFFAIYPSFFRVASDAPLRPILLVPMAAAIKDWPATPFQTSRLGLLAQSLLASQLLDCQFAALLCALLGRHAASFSPLIVSPERESLPTTCQLFPLCACRRRDHTRLNRLGVSLNT